MLKASTTNMVPLNRLIQIINENGIYAKFPISIICVLMQVDGGIYCVLDEKSIMVLVTAVGEEYQSKNIVSTSQESKGLEAFSWLCIFHLPHKVFNHKLGRNFSWL